MNWKALLVSVAAVLLLGGLVFGLFLAPQNLLRFAGPASDRVAVDEAEREVVEEAAPEEPQEFAGRELADLDEQERQEFSQEMIIKRGTQHLLTDQVTEVAHQVRELMGKFGGYVEGSSFEEEEGMERVEYNLRVPAESFDELMDDISELARLKREDVSTEDVTEEYIDLEARLEVLEAQESRLVDMLDEAEEVSEMLEIENELSRLREKIESIQGRMDYLERATSYSYLRVIIEQEKVGTPQPQNVGEEFLFSFQEGWRIFTSTLVSAVGGLLRIWPFLIAVVALAGGLAWRRKIKKQDYPPTGPNGS